MSDLLTSLKNEALRARKEARIPVLTAEGQAAHMARHSTRANLINTVIAEATKLSAEDIKKGVVVDDQRIITTLRTFRGNIDLQLNGDHARGISPVTDPVIRNRLSEERAIYSAFIPEALEGEALRSAVIKTIDALGIERPVQMKSIGEIKKALAESHPGAVDGQALAALVKTGNL